jgi:tetratricopeptide (TPR) repeat protein
MGLGGCGPLSDHFNQKGVEAFGRRDFAGAQKNFGRALFWNGSNPAFHNNLGYVLYLTKDYDRSEAEFGKSLLDKPDENLLRQIRINQALLYCDPGASSAKSGHKDWNEKGIGVLKELLGSDPDNAEFHMRLGFAYFQATNPGGGFSELDKAAQLARPVQVARYTKNPTEGALLVLRQIQQFYIKIRFFKKTKEIQEQILKIQKENSKRSLKSSPD